jgi:methylated-DNA-protein-cysteine methyltransferase-like protein
MAISSADAATLCARVYALVRACPPGRVTTYGALGAALGYPRAARAIGWIMNETPDRLAVPAQRVISKDGTLTGGWAFGGVQRMRAMLEAEGVAFDDKGRADMKRHAWEPLKDLDEAERARVLAEADALPVTPSANLLRLLNRDPASPFREAEARPSPPASRGTR